jgi:hypothetical protein
MSHSRLRFLAFVTAILCLPAMAGAAKWKHCPSRVTYRSSKIGAVGAPFIHPGHDFGIFLSEREVAVTGGFSTAPHGNTVHVTFASLFGEPVALPSFSVAAVSPASLFFLFPDTRALLGRPLAGPVAIRVTTAGRTTADILPRDLVGLPPANDVGALVGGTGTVNALATMDTEGSIWVPVEFSAYGPMSKPMMMCPGTFIPMTVFTVGVTVRATPSFVQGAPPTYPPFRALRRVESFLGDFIADGVNYYGMRLGDLPIFRVPRGWGVKVCGVNDAVDLVLRAPGLQRWAKPWSLFAGWMPSSRPLEIVMSQASAAPVTADGLDAFGAECVLR